LDLELFVRIGQLFFSFSGVPTENLHQTLAGPLLLILFGVSDSGKPLDQDGAELLDVADFLFKLVCLVFGLDVAGKFLACLNECTPDFLYEFV
jgi:hypothetical protein